MSEVCPGRWGAPLLQELTVGAIARLVCEDRVPPIDGRLPESVSNALIESLREKGRLKPLVLARLTHDKFYITQANLSSCEVDDNALSVLLLHPLTSLSLYRSTSAESLDGRDARVRLHSALREHSRSRSTLRILNLGGVNCSVPLAFLATMESFPGLEALLLPEAVALNTGLLVSIVKVLPNLRVLDLSKTQSVTDIVPLSQLTCLRVLLLHGVRLDMDAPSIASTFRALSHLEVVDLSDKRSDYHSDSTDERPRIDLALVLFEALRDCENERTFWPELKSLDLAGNPLIGVSVEEASHLARSLIAKHPHLENFSILDTPLDRLDMSPFCPSLLKIANAATRDSCMHALSLYWRPEREAFTAHSLQAVYYLLQSNYDGFGVAEINECARLFELAMRFHPKSLAIQMAASACLYHLCKLKRIRVVESHHIRRCIDRCLDAAQAYPTMTQLQKNVWLTICNDHLLQYCPIDFYRTCSVALESMLKNRDSSVARMTIAIVSIVAPKVSAYESSLLSDARYVAFLVQTIQQHLKDIASSRDNASHFALKFTLSALWNLTDECALTCTQIVDHGGVEVAFDVLAQCSDNQNICTKVLGLLNNIAEVPFLQKELMKTHYINFLVCLLECPCPSSDAPAPRIDVPYFAAGILANLVTSSMYSSTDNLPDKEAVNVQMMDVISRWPRLPYAMVAYRSFAPFIHLLRRHDCAGAQLWAVWAVEHVCVGSNGSGAEGDYIRRLRAENGVVLLRSILECPHTSHHTHSIASRILALL